MKYPRLPKVYDYRDAAMGRGNALPEDRAVELKLHLYRMPMSACGAYDSGWAYWGAGDSRIGWMYHAFNDEEAVELFVRAQDRTHAKLQILKELPKARFYR